MGYLGSSSVSTFTAQDATHRRQCATAEDKHINDANQHERRRNIKSIRENKTSSRQVTCRPLTVKTAGKSTRPNELSNFPMSSKPPFTYLIAPPSRLKTPQDAS